ncbi:hypothetical protein SLEP1_g7195 [Rubroshorea leprosula]|uniref:TF-B3 domain-containing protein n=1 Tax=Rubroshorea leprosula TaxID=152421 RepID=A0AAV5HXX6_9ROSI|nr:hypothetical protein SLEP1_g7195 [Rubroshorea leprosula]
MKSPGLGDLGCMEFTSHTPHFFKIILDDTGRCEKLRIPEKFAKRYGSDILSPVFLKVPSGAVWEVELKMCDDDTWLWNGWSEFAKHYSLGYGSFLVFRYEGNCHFHVIIFDKTALEIAYPCVRTHVKVPNPTNGGFQDLMMEDDISVEILDEVPPSKKTRVRSASPSSQPRRMTRSTSNLRSPDIKPSRVKYEIQEPEFDAKRSGKHPQKMEVCRRKPTLGHKEREKALLRASSFNSKHPFFAVVMQPSYIYDKCRMTWSVVCSREKKPKLLCGWKEFAQGNNLEVGDVCVFEMINQTKITFSVAIFRNVQDAKIGQAPVGCSEMSSPAQKCCIPDVPTRKRALVPTEKARDPPRVTSFKSENPSFTVTIQPSYVHSDVNVPCFFVEEHVKQNVEDVKLQIGDRLWPVKLLRSSRYRKTKLTSGWGTFVTQNSVKVGEVCMFELINREEAVLKVHIFRKSAE